MSAPAAPETTEPTPDQTPAPVETTTPTPEAAAEPPAAAVVLRSAKEMELEEKLTVAERRALEAERKAMEAEKREQDLKGTVSRPPKQTKPKGFKWNWAAGK